MAGFGRYCGCGPFGEAKDAATERASVLRDDMMLRSEVGLEERYAGIAFWPVCCCGRGTGAGAGTGGGMFFRTGGAPHFCVAAATMAAGDWYGLGWGWGWG